MKNKVEKIQLTLVKSMIGINPKHKLSVRGLGLKKINNSVAVLATPENKGMIDKISYLLKIESVH